METVNLALFNDIQDRDDNTVRPEAKVVSQQSSLMNPLAEIEKSLESIFPEDYQQTKINKARHVLGSLAEGYTDPQIETMLTDFEYLASCWLDLFEKKIFSGKTLREVMGESK